MASKKPTVTVEPFYGNVTTLGFSQRGEREFLVNESLGYRLRLLGVRQLELVEAKGKIVKTITGPKNYDPLELKRVRNEYKVCVKQLEQVFNLMDEELEIAMTHQRPWSTESFAQWMIQHPITGLYSKALIFALIDAQGEYISTFRISSEREILSYDEAKQTLPAGSKVVLAHPIKMKVDERQKWIERLHDYKVIQPLAQLDRPIVQSDSEAQQIIKNAKKEFHLLDSVFTGELKWTAAKPTPSSACYQWFEKYFFGCQARVTFTPEVRIRNYTGEVQLGLQLLTSIGAPSWQYRVDGVYEPVSPVMKIAWSEALVAVKKASES